jgi:hypothetical protein
MREMLSSGLKFEKEEITPAKAKKLFAGEPYKLELIDELKKEKNRLPFTRRRLREAKNPFSPISAPDPTLNLLPKYRRRIQARKARRSILERRRKE